MVGFLLKIPQGGVLPGEGWRGPRGREGVCREFFFGGGRGGLNIFFRGRDAHEVPPVKGPLSW